jgi:hypothetical protein
MKMASDALGGLEATFKPHNFSFVMAQLTLKTLEVSVLLFHDFDHWQEVRHVYIERKDSLRVVVFDYALNGWEQMSVHSAIVGGFVFAGVERAEDGFRHDASPAKCLKQS